MKPIYLVLILLLSTAVNAQTQFFNPDGSEIAHMDFMVSVFPTVETDDSVGFWYWWPMSSLDENSVPTTYEHSPQVFDGRYDFYNGTPAPSDSRHFALPVGGDTMCFMFVPGTDYNLVDQFWDSLHLRSQVRTPLAYSVWDVPEHVTPYDAGYNPAKFQYSEDQVDSLGGSFKVRKSYNLVSWPSTRYPTYTNFTLYHAAAPYEEVTYRFPNGQNIVTIYGSQSRLPEKYTMLVYSSEVIGMDGKRYLWGEAPSGVYIFDRKRVFK